MLTGLCIGSGCQDDTEASDSNESTGEESADDANASGPDDTADVTGGGAVELSGSVQKGPFILGSSVEVTPLDAGGAPMGDVFPTQTTNDLGEFEVELPAPGPVSIESSGFYYNEVSGRLSEAELTLRAIYVSPGPGPQDAYVNIITHLTEGRVRQLIEDGAAFEAAIEQAEEELRVALGIGLPEFDPGAAGTEMNLLGGDTPANQYLLAVSSVLAQAGVIRAGGLGGPIDANLQAVINEISVALADGGEITGSLRAEIDAAELALDTSDVEASFSDRLEEIGSGAAVPDIDEVLDQDDDSIVNVDDNCEQAANPAQVNTDLDEYGDACDNCPGAENDDQIDLDMDEVGDACDMQCGDGIVGPDEECDDYANTNNGDDCTDLCTVPVCGDGIAWEDEECDDGNALNGDGCNDGCIASGKLLWELEWVAPITEGLVDADSTGAAVVVARDGGGWYIRNVSPAGAENWTVALPSTHYLHALDVAPDDTIVISGADDTIASVFRYQDDGDPIDSGEIGPGSAFGVAADATGRIAFGLNPSGATTVIGVLEGDLQLGWNETIDPVTVTQNETTGAAWGVDGSAIFGMRLPQPDTNSYVLTSRDADTGSELWTTEAFDTDLSTDIHVAVGPSGEVVVAGADANPPPTIVVVRAFDPDGTPTWSFDHEASDEEDVARALRVDSSGNTIVGYKTQGADVLTTSVFKLDGDGDLLWQWDDPGPADEANIIDDLAIDPTNNEIVLVMRKDAFDSPRRWLGRLTE